MDGILVQDWTTIRVTGASSTIVQTEGSWIDVDAYGDLVFWLEVRDRRLGGGTAIVFAYQTSPSKDESLFSSLSVFPLAVTTTPYITKVIDGIASVTPAAWLRWAMSPVGSPSGEWGATFRLHVAGNRRRSG